MLYHERDSRLLFDQLITIFGYSVLDDVVTSSNEVIQFIPCDPNIASVKNVLAEVWPRAGVLTRALDTAPPDHDRLVSAVELKWVEIDPSRPYQYRDSGARMSGYN